jgi:hypothetical protein
VVVFHLAKNKGTLLGPPPPPPPAAAKLAHSLPRTRRTELMLIFADDEQILNSCDLNATSF